MFSALPHEAVSDSPHKRSNEQEYSHIYNTRSLWRWRKILITLHLFREFIHMKVALSSIHRLQAL